MSKTAQMISDAITVLSVYHRHCSEPISRFRDDNPDAEVDIYVVSCPELRKAFREATDSIFGATEEIGSRAVDSQNTEQVLNRQSSVEASK